MDRGAILGRELFYSFYGDDFTGSTDVLETLALNGIPAALFLEPPDKREIEQFSLKVGVGCSNGSRRLKAFGVAGISRSLTPHEMDVELPGIFESISSIPTDFFQYKICSTFDSSVAIGNIGHAVEIALKYFPSAYIPLIVAAPFLNRFVVFGNLFARVDQHTYRLDRHPTMSKHPVTPMTESDLAVHLRHQTNRKIQLMDQFAMEGEYGKPEEMLSQLTAETGYVIFDTMDLNHLRIIGRLLVNRRDSPCQFILGSSGAVYALALQLQEMGKIQKFQELSKPGEAQKMVITAGSCAPGTRDQILHMQSLEHPGIRMDTMKIIDPIDHGQEINTVVQQALNTISRKQVPVIYTALGPDDLAIAATTQRIESAGETSGSAGRIIAEAQGKVLKEIIAKTGKLRIAVAGGDTSGYVSRALGIYALETLHPIAPGAPLCVAHSKNSAFDGLEIALKGGQNGNKKYFESILKGESLN
ncbi:MAG: hypothetical protein DHS20C17_22190 [Cyclobacteriaceae bacterium]|nr:MAG: hypothetical protein DHS20C17_22190 [Cyclobacteriaceae bacterium]